MSCNGAAHSSVCSWARHLNFGRSRVIVYVCCRFFLTSLFSLQQEKPVQHLWKHALTHVTLIYYTTCWNDCDFCGLLEYCHDLSSPPSETLFCKTLALFTHLHTYYSTVRFGTAGVWWVFGGSLHSWTAFGVILWSTAVLRQNITFFRIDLKIKKCLLFVEQTCQHTNVFFGWRLYILFNTFYRFRCIKSFKLFHVSL